MPTASNDGIEIGYEVQGDDNEETVVFVSGLGYGRWFWQWQMPAFEDDYQTVLWDLRGIDKSDTPEGPYSIEEMASDLEAVLDDAGVEEAHILGISMGGMIAQRYAADYDRAKSLVLMSTDPGGDESIDPAPEVADRILNPPQDVTPRQNIGYKMQPAFTDNFWEVQEETIEKILDLRVENPVSDEVRGWQAAGVAAFEMGDELEDIDIPTLVLHGERDKVVPVENSEILADRIPNAERVIYDRGGSHLFIIERRQAVNGRILDFLARVEKPARALADD